MKKLIYCLLILIVAGCVSLKSPIKPGYDGDTSRIADTYARHFRESAHFYVLKQVNGIEVENSSHTTRISNYGKGAKMTPKMVTREVMSVEQEFTIAGFVQFAMPIQEMFGNNLYVEKTVRFTPKPNEEYLIKGILSESKVWIEDSSGNKIE